ncbi:hypothetical protein NM208_g2743 [Fusarium decemcellulare]|uniref:Uncharacterized protein n=1 Tax=Fusarium decemcellulare TaxID=57161 RepID=A0ACC1SS16_9HYPO|nr:hypothetical protein NM208_g2743 [Fusarium decemcellulare]
MGATVHPAQRRFSCETCRKQKARCHRPNPNEPRCLRCILLDVECTSGQQKRVGRPRRAAQTAKSAAQTGNSPQSGTNDPDITTTEELSSPHANEPPVASLPMDVADELSWSSLFQPTLIPIPMLDRTPDPFPQETQAGAGIDMLSNLPLPASSAQDRPMGDYNDSYDNNSPTINPAFGIPTPNSNSAHGSPPGLATPSSDTYDQTRTSTKPQSVQPVTIGISASEAMVSLSNINIALQLRVNAVETNRASIDFNSITYKDSPLFIDNTTFAGFLMASSQKFLLILLRLKISSASWMILRHMAIPRRSQIHSGHLDPQYHSDNQHDLSSSSSLHTSAASEPLLAPLSLLITSIFVQLISLYELTLDHLTTRIDRIAIDPIAPIPDLTFGGLPITEPCTQGLLFAEVNIHQLERIERCLGIDMVPQGGEPGLLSKRQMAVLWNELDENSYRAYGRGAVRPANVRRMLKMVGKTFKQISLSL